ncbi:MAG TPA: hypothetical protein PLH46_03800 [Caldisericia bacterium]|nr:hypothetical protein [Candidatus Pacearchaeota archaeon]HOU79209.1 hypothetical protein [Candidatus Pacearchaeota archaeon]HQI57873.1 hypothetical protein [Candidatus Pacearchaeota archaeon]HQJ56749.1 hypothetical protein [Caldisericia bacterium]
MKIYDCFTFYNELDLLELRLNELDNSVDYFVLVEATKTHRWKDKSLYFQDNKKRFKKWEHKIIHVIVRDLPKPGRTYGNNWRINSLLKGGAWKTESFQRTAIVRGLTNCNDEDIVMVSDLDEIPRPRKIPEMVKALTLKNEKIVSFDQSFYNFFLNGFTSTGWTGTRACTFRNFRKLFNKDMNRVRHLRNLPLRLQMILGKKLYIIKDGGWHFSFLGNVETIINKIASICHFEKDTPENKDPKKILEKINSGKFLYDNKTVTYVPIDESFPKTVYKNQKKYKKYIMPIK